MRPSQFLASKCMIRCQQGLVKSSCFVEGLSETTVHFASAGEVPVEPILFLTDTSLY